LFCSGAYIDANTLFELGLLTTMTGHKPYLGLQYSETLPLKYVLLLLLCLSHPFFDVILLLSQ
jgi:hypothetical protein